MGEAGVLDPNARIELIDGEMIDMPPIAPPHAGRTKRLNLLLIEAIGRRAVVSTQDPVLLGDLSAPQLDIAILKPREDFYTQAHPQAEDVLLVIEIADSSGTVGRSGWACMAGIAARFCCAAIRAMRSLNRSPPSQIWPCSDRHGESASTPTATNRR
jgi:hypothetical protein